MTKKIITLIIIILITTGCFDYKELNNLGIVTGIAIDYDNNKYTVTIEILNDKKEAKETNLEAYTLSSSGKNITDAITNVNEKLDKEAFYPHTKVVIINEEIAKNHIKDLTDFFLRNSSIRDEFYLLVAINTSAKNILESQEDNYPVVSNRLVSMLEKDNNNKNIASKLLFEKNINILLNGKKDIVLTTITKKDNQLKLSGLAIFNEFNMIDILSEENSITYNLFVNTNNNSIFNYQCSNNGLFTLNVYNSNSDIKYNNNIFILNLNLGANVILNDCDYDLRESKTVEKIESIFNKEISEKVNKLINITKRNNTDILGLNEIYYKKYRKNIDFRLIDTKIIVDLIINKEGSIFEVDYED